MLIDRLFARPWHVWLILGLLAGQFAITNLLTRPLFGDAPRNLHWGIYTAENPAYLIGATDPLEQIKGFPPDPASLAPLGQPTRRVLSLHSWWGPIVLLVLAGVWKLSGSVGLLQLVIPLATGAAVILSFLLARDMLGQRRALLATLFLAWFPIFREFGSTSYVETFSALIVVAALLAYWRGNMPMTILFGTLTALTKMDLLPLYLGAIGGCALASRQSWRPWSYQLIAALVPLLLASPWIWYHYLHQGRGGISAGLSAEIFAQLIPQMTALLFYIPWYASLIVIVAIGAAVVAGLRAHRLTRPAVGLLLGWLGTALAVLLVYAATPGAGNSPRILIPALPALAILFAAGIGVLPTAWRRRIGFGLAALFTGVNLLLIGYYASETAQVRRYEPAWAMLRERPQGFVLTERYWETLLFTRQPVTWFEDDKVFQRNMMENAGNFERYVTQHPIRYVILPRDGRLAAPEVRAYLDAHATQEQAGDYLLYTLTP